MKKYIIIVLLITIIGVGAYFFIRNNDVKLEDQIKNDLIVYSAKLQSDVITKNYPFESTNIAKEWIEENSDTSLSCDEIYYSNDKKFLLHGCVIDGVKYYFYNGQLYNLEEADYRDLYEKIKNETIIIEKGNLLSTLATIDLNLEITEIDPCVNEGICEVGTPLAIQVNDFEVYKFYVLADDGEKVNLILSGNISNGVIWAPSDNLEGPVDLVTSLKNHTDDWTNIAIRNYKIADDNSNKVYSDIYESMRATLPSYTQIAAVCEDNVVPNWLLENLESELVNGYWLSSASRSMSFYAWGVLEEGKLETNDVSKEDFGLRPVIIVYK